MKNTILLLLLALCIGTSCRKNHLNPLVYAIDPITNAYVPNNDSAALRVPVKFYSGNQDETVWVTIEGLPNHVTLTQDTITGTPTFTANFVLNANGAVLGSYPVTLVSYSYNNGIRKTPFTLNVVNSGCVTAMAATYTGSNACSSSGYTYSAVASVSGGELSVSNFGGYGPVTTTNMILDCNSSTVTIPSQLIGNGVTVSGSGTFTTNTITVSYIALNLPNGTNDTCTAIFSR